MTDGNKGTVGKVVVWSFFCAHLHIEDRDGGSISLPWLDTLWGQDAKKRNVKRETLPQNVKMR